ncbi:DUF362 domain-containing protein [Patescibacteria group bacterium]|nr:DUF362 domain-containing protein [Patescibacteria group bacterium]MBU1889964.1 DUF362 domain-containing protein [Patescibacteria group bacterium]
MKNNQVFVHLSNTFDYPLPPFDPSKHFPELESLGNVVSGLDPKNNVYNHIRETLLGVGLDKEHQGSPDWNPYHNLIQPGQTVVIKPNLVKGNHPLGKIGVKSMITQAAVIRPIIDYLLLATNKNVNIIIADVPLQSSDWDEIIRGSQLKDLVEYYKSKGINIPLLDLRKEISHQNKYGVINKRDFKDRDPLGYTIVDMKDKSRLMPVIDKSSKFRITDYGKGTVPPHHNKDRNEYYICNTILSADLLINVPKLKSHRKAGLTSAMKNLIGINGDKRWLAHHRAGSPKQGGDEFYKKNAWMYFKWHFFDLLKRSRWTIPIATLIRKYYEKLVLKQTMEEAALKTNPSLKNVMEGSWYGNDTIWRCIIDLNNIILFADKSGHLHQTPQRKYFCLVDGLLGGEGEGPMEQTPKESGVILVGTNPVAMEFISAKIMGFDWNKIPHIRESFTEQFFPLTGFKPNDISIISNSDQTQSLNLKFKPSAGWAGHIELE